MGTLRIVPFEDAFIDEAAALLAARHRRDRAFEPALRERFVEIDGARAATLSAWHESHPSGTVALRDGHIAGYLIGSQEIAEIWGRSVWVRYNGHALAEGEDAELYRDLYAAAAPDWLAHGCFAHYIEIPAGDPAGINAWFRLSFGLQHALGIRPLTSEDAPAPPLDPAITIRRAGPDDANMLARMHGILYRHLGLSPVYSVRLPEDADGFYAAATSALTDPLIAVWLAEKDTKALGAVKICPLTPGDDVIDAPDHCCYFAFAATREEARGHGISSALTTHALREAQREGYRASLTDWRVTNLQASRLWPALGFRPFQYRLHRLLDDRIAWSPDFPHLRHGKAD